MFESIEAAAPDAILGLMEVFRADGNPDKINLTVGVFKDESGLTPVLKCVKAAERRLLDNETTKTYLPISGLSDFCRQTQELYFGANHEVVTSSRAATVQTPGGTGALRVAADFLKHNLGSDTIWCSTPTWPNHPKVFKAGGIEVKNYPYFDADSHGVNVDAMLEAIRKMPAGNVICLHACCHNPTGADPTMEQWKQIADAVYERGLLPLLDFAYLGFGDGIQQDAAALLQFARPETELLVASSYSKNFGLYSERVGALSVVTQNRDAVKTVDSQLKATIRTNYSNPPEHGAAIVSTILNDADLTAQWESELAAMRDRINGMRTLFTQKMSEKLPDREFTFIERQRGMFSYTGLTPEQVDRLREEHSVYIVRDGRINVAGISHANVDALCAAIAKVLAD
ncbi:aminotransferase class I/II-fold pyridoxal phosphate-dependent enzyme [bacterium]|nr:aminotransferase class I/II-fold pyridoxal phosphate-dependent enzyme [bacterium]